MLPFLLLVSLIIWTAISKTKVVFLDTGNTCRSPMLMYLAKQLQTDGSFSNVEFDSAAYRATGRVTSGDRTNQDKGLSVETYKLLKRFGIRDFPDRQPRTVSPDIFPIADKTQLPRFYVICNDEYPAICGDNLRETGKLLGDEEYDHLNVFGVIEDPYQDKIIPSIDKGKPIKPEVKYPAMFVRAQSLLLRYRNDDGSWDITDNKFGTTKSSEPPAAWITEWTGSGKQKYEDDLKKFYERYYDMKNKKGNTETCVDNSWCKEGCKCGSIRKKCKPKWFETCPASGHSNVHNTDPYKLLMPNGAFVTAAHTQYYDDMYYDDIYYDDIYYDDMYNEKVEENEQEIQKEEMEELIPYLREKKMFKQRLFNKYA